MKLSHTDIDEHLEGALSPREVHAKKPPLRKFKERAEARDNMRVRERTLFEEQKKRERKP